MNPITNRYDFKLFIRIRPFTQGLAGARLARVPEPSGLVSRHPGPAANARIPRPERTADRGILRVMTTSSGRSGMGDELVGPENGRNPRPSYFKASRRKRWLSPRAGESRLFSTSTAAVACVLDHTPEQAGHPRSRLGALGKATNFPIGFPRMHPLHKIVPSRRTIVDREKCSPRVRGREKSPSPRGGSIHRLFAS
jgi:hypothetical protein